MSTDITNLISEAWRAKDRGEIEDTTQYIRDRLRDDEREMYDRTMAELNESIAHLTDTLREIYGIKTA